MPLEIVTIPCLADNYCYLVHGNGQTALVDATEAAPIQAALAARGWRLDQIWITHHHHDHVECVDALRGGATVIGAAADAHRLPRLDRAVAPGDRIELGGATAEVLGVPGHTLGHIAYLIGGAVFTADSLMTLGCGRVNEGTHAMMWDSLSRLMALPPETRVYSGHNYGAKNARFALSLDPGNAALVARAERIAAADAAGSPIVPVTLAEEIATNPFLRAGTPAVQAALGLAGADAAGVFAELRRRRDVF